MNHHTLLKPTSLALLIAASSGLLIAAHKDQTPEHTANTQETRENQEPAQEESTQSLTQETASLELAQEDAAQEDAIQEVVQVIDAPEPTLNEALQTPAQELAPQEVVQPDEAQGAAPVETAQPPVQATPVQEPVQNTPPAPAQATPSEHDRFADDILKVARSNAIREFLIAVKAAPTYDLKTGTQFESMLVTSQEVKRTFDELDSVIESNHLSEDDVHHLDLIAGLLIKKHDYPLSLQVVQKAQAGLFYINKPRQALTLARRAITRTLNALRDVKNPSCIEQTLQEIDYLAGNSLYILKKSDNSYNKVEVLDQFSRALEAAPDLAVAHRDLAVQQELRQTIEQRRFLTRKINEASKQLAAKKTELKSLKTHEAQAAQDDISRLEAALAKALLSHKDDTVDSDQLEATCHELAQALQSVTEPDTTKSQPDQAAPDLVNSQPSSKAPQDLTALAFWLQRYFNYHLNSKQQDITESLVSLADTQAHPSLMHLHAKAAYFVNSAFESKAAITQEVVRQFVLRWTNNYFNAQQPLLKNHIKATFSKLKEDMLNSISPAFRAESTATMELSATPYLKDPLRTPDVAHDKSVYFMEDFRSDGVRFRALESAETLTDWYNVLNIAELVGLTLFYCEKRATTAADKKSLDHAAFTQSLTSHLQRNNYSALAQMVDEFTKLLSETPSDAIEHQKDALREKFHIRKPHIFGQDKTRQLNSGRERSVTIDPRKQAGATAQ